MTITLASRYLGTTLIFMAIGNVTANDDRLVVGEITHRLVAPVDDDGDVRISIKVGLRNVSADDLSVFVNMQSLDADGFAVFQTPVSATIEMGASENLSDWLYLQESAYLTMDRWIVHSLRAFTTTIREESRVVVGEVAWKIVEPEDEGGDVRFAIKVPVENLMGVTQSVALHAMGLDKEGFVLDAFRLKGVVPPGETGDLTESHYLFKDAQKDIVSWKVEVESVRPDD